jgi:hypothetical protein
VLRRSLSGFINPGIVGAALAIHLIATVEDFDILRRIDIVSVNVWLLRRWRLAQDFLSNLCLRIRAHIREVKMKIAACDVCSTTDEVAIFVGLAAGGALIGYLIAREERLLIYSAP